MGMKDLARNIITIKDILKVSFRETGSTLHRNKLFNKSYLESRMLVVAHSLEKGMGLPDIKKGFGVKKAKNLCQYIEKYIVQNPDSSNFALLESIGILKEYARFQKSMHITIDDIQKSLDNILNSMSESQIYEISKLKCGIYWQDKISLKQGVNIDFERFASSRHSARVYSSQEVTRADISEAVRLANYAPSACNRQPCKVYCALGKDSASKLEELLTGNKAFTSTVSNFVVVTCDRAYFAGDEQYQWYINGGIYLSYLVLALHSLGIGSCIMQWFEFSRNEKRIKHLFDISASEAIVGICCLGYYPESMKCICAQRRTSNDILTFLP